eukprot:1138770-Pelagomonas_calceolata.AAC.7
MACSAERKKRWEEAHRGAIATATAELAKFDKDAKKVRRHAPLRYLAVCRPAHFCQFWTHHLGAS